MKMVCRFGERVTLTVEDRPKDAAKATAFMRFTGTSKQLATALVLGLGVKGEAAKVKLFPNHNKRIKDLEAELQQQRNNYRELAQHHNQWCSNCSEIY